MNEGEERVANRWLVLALLILVYAVSAADRQLISVLAEPIRLDLKLTDSQLGMLSGFIFAFFYTVCGVPFGWLADRFQRFRLIGAIGLFWSLCTGLSGLTVSFVQLALARVGVAVGEAGTSPPTYALIADHFPRDQRTTAFGIFSIGFPLGAASGTAFAAWIAAHHGWRTAFLAMAVPGVLLFVALLFLPHPRRGRLDGGPAVAAAAPPFRLVLREFFGRRILWMTALASCLSSLPSYAMIVWTPALLMRTKGMSLMEISALYSLVLGGSMIAGATLSGWLTDRLSRVTHRAAALVPGISSVFAIPLVLAAIWVPGWQAALLLMIVPFVIMAMWFPPALGLLQNECRPEIRALMAGLFLTFCGIVGTGGGPALVGLLSDLFARTDPATSLNWALTAIVPFFLIAAIAHFANAAAMGRREVIEAAE